MNPANSLQQEINELLGAKTLKFQDKHPECFAPSQTVTIGANTLTTNGVKNGQQWKTLLPFQAT
jgi:hypothetical protein